MKEEKQIRMVRMSIYLLIWTLLFLFPIIFNNRNGDLNWNRVFSDWIRFVPFLLIFFLHHFALLPILILRKNRAVYLALTLVMILVVSFLTPNLRFLNDLIQDLGPPAIDPQRSPLEPFRNRPPQPLPAGLQGGVLRPIQPLMFYNFLVSVMLVGFDAAISIFSEWFRQEQRAREIEKDQIQTELAFLRNQVSPHFFMNTLNNIHALIEDDQAKAQGAVIRLSKLMRYLLYETGDLVPLKKELEFISSYFDLMRMRYDKKVIIELDLPSNIPETKVHPLLSISFIENAFKHGVSYHSDSFVKVKVDLGENDIEFRISNSKVPESPRPESPSPGIGLENAKKQLSTLYENDYTLDIRTEANSYFVYLQIPLSHD